MSIQKCVPLDQYYYKLAQLPNVKNYLYTASNKSEIGVYETQWWIYYIQSTADHIDEQKCISHIVLAKSRRRHDAGVCETHLRK